MCTKMPYNSNSSTTSSSTSFSGFSTSSASMATDGQSVSISKEEAPLLSGQVTTTMMLMMPSTSSAVQLDASAQPKLPPPSSARRKRNGAVEVARAATAIQIFGNDGFASASSSSGTADAVLATRRKSAAQPRPTVYDVFLGGSCGNTVWRQDLVIPYLKKRSITYYDPQRPAWSENMIYEEAVAKENSRLFLFVLDPGNINATSFLEIAYLSARKAPKLVVVFLGRREWSGKAHPMDLPDRIRTCDLLEAILKRHSVPMLNSISEALDCVDEMIIGEQSWRSAMANPLQRLPFVRVRAARLARLTRDVCAKALRPRAAAVCVVRRVGVLLAVEAAVCLLLITFVFYKAPTWTVLLPFIVFDYLSVIVALVYCRFQSRQRKSDKPAYLLLAGGGAPLPRLNDAGGRRRGCADDYNAAVTATAAAATQLLLQNAGKSASLSTQSTSATPVLAAASLPTAAKPWNQVQRSYAPPSPLPYSATFPSDAALRVPPPPYAASDATCATFAVGVEQEALLLDETATTQPVALTAAPSPLRRRRSGPHQSTAPASGLSNVGSSPDDVTPPSSPPLVLATRRETYVEEPEVGTFAALAECLRRQEEETEVRRGSGAKESKRKDSSPFGADFGKQLASAATMVDAAVRRHEAAALVPPQTMATALAASSRKHFGRAPTATALLSAGGIAAAPSTSVVGYDVFLSCSSSSELDWITQQAVPQLHKSGLSYTSALMYDKDVRIPMLHTASHILYYIPSYKTFLSGMIEIAYFIGHWDWQVTVCVPREAECLMLPNDQDGHCDGKHHDAETIRAVERRNECYRMAFCYLKDMAQRRQCRIFTRVEDAVQHIANDKHREGGGGRHASAAAQRRKGGARLRQIVEKQHLFKKGARADNAASIDVLMTANTGAESGSCSSGTVADYLAFLSSSLGVSGHEKSAELVLP